MHPCFFRVQRTHHFLDHFGFQRIKPVSCKSVDIAVSIQICSKVDKSVYPACLFVSAL